MVDKRNTAVHGLNIRLWAIKGGVHPYHSLEYMALSKIGGDPTKSRGDATRITAPDPNNFDSDITIGQVPGTEERGTMTISRRYTVEIAKLLKWFHDGCRVDFFGLVGKCGSATDFENGGEKFIYFNDGQPSTHTIEGAGAFGRDESNMSNENLDITIENYWEIFKVDSEEIMAAATTREIKTVDICDDVACGDCETCQRLLATMSGTGATPGTQPTLIYSEDGGVTYSTETIDTLFSDEDIADAHCIGGDFVLITNEGNEIHYRNVDDLYLGIGEWNQVDTGFVFGGAPNKMWSVDPRHTWIVGNGGYIYFSKNPRAGVTVQNAGVATTQNLNYVHAVDSENVLVVGNNNTVLLSTNGGNTWRNVTGPSVGENLGICWMWDEDTWFVGTGSGGSGKLYKTQDAGFTWDEVPLPVTPNRFDAIRFASEAEGWIAVRVGGNAKVLRTIVGGADDLWWEAPDTRKGSIESFDYANDIAVCSKFEGKAFVGGLGDDGSEGIMVAISGPSA